MRALNGHPVRSSKCRRGPDMAKLTEEERIARAAEKADPEFARVQFSAELEDGQYLEAGGTFMVALYHRAIALMKSEDFQIGWKDAPEGGFSTIVGIVVALKKTVSDLGDNAPVRLQVALETFSSIGRTQAILEGRDPDCVDEGVRTAKLMLASAAMGHCDSMLSLFENGHWDDFGDAKWKLFQIGSGQRGRLATWEELFLPVAVAYCQGKKQVQLADLRRLAQRWAKDEIASGRNPGLPGTDKGIADGLKRMEKSKQLKIPGRPRGT